MGVGVFRVLRSWPHHPTDRCALVPPSSERRGACSSGVGGRESGVRSRRSEVRGRRSEVRGRRSVEYEHSCSFELPSFPRRGGPRLSVVGWFGAVGRSFGDLLHGPGLKLPTPAGRRPPLPSALPTPLPLQASLPPTCRRTPPGSPPMALNLHGPVVAIEGERSASRDALAGDDGGRPPPERRPSIP